MGRGSGLLVEMVAAEAGQLSERQRWGRAARTRSVFPGQERQLMLSVMSYPG